MIHRLLNREAITAEAKLLAVTRKAVKLERDGRVAWLFHWRSFAAILN